MKAEVGHEIELVKNPTTRTLVQYAGASGDFYEIHYDQDYAHSVGLPGVILHGLLQAGFLAQLVTDFGRDAKLEFAKSARMKRACYSGVRLEASSTAVLPHSTQDGQMRSQNKLFLPSTPTVRGSLLLALSICASAPLVRRQ